MAIRRPEPPPEVSPQPVLSLSASQRVPYEYQQGSVFLETPPHLQFAGSEVMHQRSLSYHSTKTNSAGHSVPHQRHDDRIDTTSSGRVRGPAFGEHLPNCNGDSSGWSSIDRPSRQSYDEGYGFMQAPQQGTEQTTMYQSNALLGLDSSNSSPGQNRFGVTGEHLGPNGTRTSLCFRSVTDYHEAGRDVGFLPWSSATGDINLGLVSDSQLNGNQVNPYTIGIDRSTIGESYDQIYNAFSADIDETGIDETDGGRGGGGGGGGENAQNGEPSRNSDDLDGSALSGLSASMTTSPDTISDTFSHAASRTAPHSRGRTQNSARGRARTRARGRAGHRTFQLISSESSVTTCEICENDPHCERRPIYGGSADSQRSSLRRHMHEEHCDGQSWYQCSIDNDGSVCGKLISRRDNRRRHVENVHPAKSMELPPRDAATRAPNHITSAFLDEWIPKVQ